MNACSLYILEDVRYDCASALMLTISHNDL